MPPDSRPSSQVWQREDDGSRGLILDIPALLHGKERRCAFDAYRPAQGSVGPLHGNVFGPTFQVWASVVVWGRLAHRRTLGACPNSHCSILSESDSSLGHEQVFSPLEYRSDAASAAECAGLRAERPCLAVYR